MMLPMMLFPLGIDAQGNFNNLMLCILCCLLSAHVCFYLCSVQGILMAFFQSAWAVTYLRLSNNANTPIIVEEKPTGGGV